MRHALVSFAGLALAVAAACGTKKGDPPAGVTPGTGGDAGTGGSAGRGSGGKGGKSGTGGSSGRAGADGTAGDELGGASGADDGGAGSGGSSGAGGSGKGQGGAGGSAGGSGGVVNGGSAGLAIAGRGEEPDPCSELPDDPPAAAGVCEPGAGWGAGQAVAVMADGADPLIAITPDERTLLLLHVTSVGEAMIADRADAGDDFGTPVLVGIEGVVGLSPDGLRVIVRASDGSLQEASRSGPGEDFGSLGEGAFSALNAAAGSDSLSLSAPVIAPDDRTLYYLAVPPEGTDYPLHVSTRAGAGAWPVGTAVQDCRLKSFQGFNPVPTGVSSDGLTLFFWDSLYSTARAGFRETATGPFVWFDDLGSLAAAQPNTACNRLYYSEDGILFASPG
jgi:hypothetical protein